MNKTPKASEEKTASAHNGHLLWTLAGLIICAFMVAAALSVISKDDFVVLRIKDRSYRMELADTPGQRQQGLSGRPNLDENEGMLFRFEEDGTHCFWMKDMNFDLDIVWLNYWGEIVHFEENVSPSSYPKGFCPKQPAKYVLEFKAGTIKRLQLDDKDKIFLPCLLRQGCYN